MLRSHLFFKIVQNDWIQRIKARHRDIEITEGMVSNLINGGSCNCFDLIDEIQKAFKNQREISELLIHNLKPDCLLVDSEDRADKILKFVVLKITNKIAKIGKDLKSIFDDMDRCNRGYCKCLFD